MNYTMKKRFWISALMACVGGGMLYLCGAGDVLAQAAGGITKAGGESQTFWVLFRQGKGAEALATLRAAYAKKPDAEIAAHIGEVLWALGRTEEALAVWREAAKAHPSNEVLTATIKRFVP